MVLCTWTLGPLQRTSTVLNWFWNIIKLAKCVYAFSCIGPSNLKLWLHIPGTFPILFLWYLFLPGVLLLKFLLIVDETARTKPSFLKLFLLSIFLYYGNFVMKMFLLLFDLLKQTVQFHLLLKHSVHFIRCLWHLHFSPHVFRFCLSSGRPSSMAIHTGRWWLTAPLKKT